MAIVWKSPVLLQNKLYHHPLSLFPSLHTAPLPPLRLSGGSCATITNNLLLLLLLRSRA